MAIDGSSAQFEDFIDDNQLRALNHISEDSHPELVAQMMVEYQVDGKPTFVAVRGDGQYQSFAGWSEWRFDRTLNWLDD